MGTSLPVADEDVPIEKFYNDNKITDYEINLVKHTAMLNNDEKMFVDICIKPKTIDKT